ncbi:hypothetical protein VTL71DRAFT_12407 [Oculimacula yallundae]|uniref:1-alkyl-2-acetylglycerophosphocholine esterase n=1 Tax=Oculimacula yallundae TaxID=86028 RepID=A0ABR4CN08_9HELO
MKLLTILVAISSTGYSLLLPNLLGPHAVGTVRLELIDRSRLDPLATNRSFRDLMVSVFYPTTDQTPTLFANSFTPLYSSFLDTRLSLTPGVAGSIVSRAREAAKLKSSSSCPPILLFSPNYQGSRVEFTATLSSMASLGYIVIGVDHPYDTSFVDYPDGRTIYGLQAAPVNASQAAQLVSIRVADMSFVLDTLAKNKTWTKQIPGLHGLLGISRVGIFGHELGGATAAATMLVDLRFACGLTVDGSLYGPVVDKGLKRPFKLFAAEGHNRSTDTSWSKFWAASKTQKEEVSVNGSTTASFADSSFIYEKLKGQGVPDFGDIFGTISGTEALLILSIQLREFFGRCLT